MSPPGIQTYLGPSLLKASALPTEQGLNDILYFHVFSVHTALCFLLSLKEWSLVIIVVVA